jgi:hypothetical protein
MLILEKKSSVLQEISVKLSLLLSMGLLWQFTKAVALDCGFMKAKINIRFEQK